MEGRNLPIYECRRLGRNIVLVATGGPTCSVPSVLALIAKSSEPQRSPSGSYKFSSLLFMKPSLRPGNLLLADPSLHGSYFGRTVILLTSHTPDEGTQGFLLNRPSGKVLHDLLTSADFKLLRDVPVFEGGPVSPSEMMLMALRWNDATHRLESRAPLGIDGAVRARAEGWEIRAFTGYTGWSAGQLEGEIEQTSWIITPPQPAALAPQPDISLWSILLRNLPDPRQALLADQPDDPGLN